MKNQLMAVFLLVFLDLRTLLGKGNGPNYVLGLYRYPHLQTCLRVQSPVFSDAVSLKILASN